MQQKELNRLCELARLYLQPSEQEGFLQEMEEIIAFAQAVCRSIGGNEGDQSEEEMAVNMREDIPGPCSNREEILRNTQQSKDGFFVLSRKR